jgi:hypothetical protein
MTHIPIQILDSLFAALFLYATATMDDATYVRPPLRARQVISTVFALNMLAL